jgi:hypothetical protein
MHFPAWPNTLTNKIHHRNIAVSHIRGGPIITFPMAVQIATRLHNLQRYSSRLLFSVASVLCAIIWLRIRGEINILMYYTTRDRIQILLFFLFYFCPLSPLPSFMKFTYNLFKDRKRDSSVGIATSYGLEGRGSVPGRNKRFFSSPQRPDRFWGLSRLQWVPKALFPGVKRPGNEADHSSPSSDKVKNGGTSLPLPSTYSSSGV